MKDKTTIQDFVYRNDLDSVRNFLQRNPDCINNVDPDGKTALMIAASFNRTEALSILLSYTLCDVNCVDTDGNTALHEAADQGYTDIVKALVESDRCDVNIQNLQGETALMKAAVYDYIDIVRLMLKNESLNLNTVDVTGQSALFVSLREGSQITADVLIKSGCDVNIVDKTGRSALYMAIHSPLMKSLDSAKRIVEAGYDISIDKMWILNEEKHILFYQDDDFYSHLRHRLRHYPGDLQTQNQDDSSGSTTSHNTIHRTTSSPPPFSMSPMIKQKLLSPVSFSNKPIDWRTPPTSPVYYRRMTSRSSISGARPSLTSKSSSFDSDTTESPCSSPGIFAYPTTHILLHTFLKKQSSEESDDGIVFSRQNSINNQKCDSEDVSPTDIQSRWGKQSQNNSVFLRQSSIASMRNYGRQKSDMPQVPAAKLTDKRKISLPSKPSVHFNTNIEIIDIKARN